MNKRFVKTVFLASFSATACVQTPASDSLSAAPTDAPIQRSGLVNLPQNGVPLGVDLDRIDQLSPFGADGFVEPPKITIELEGVGRDSFPEPDAQFLRSSADGARISPGGGDIAFDDGCFITDDLGVRFRIKINSDAAIQGVVIRSGVPYLSLAPETFTRRSGLVTSETVEKRTLTETPDGFIEISDEGVSISTGFGFERSPILGDRGEVIGFEPFYQGSTDIEYRFAAFPSGPNGFLWPSSPTPFEVSVRNFVGGRTVVNLTLNPRSPVGCVGAG